MLPRFTASNIGAISHAKRHVSAHFHAHTCPGSHQSPEQGSQTQQFAQCTPFQTRTAVSPTRLAVIPLPSRIPSTAAALVSAPSSLPREQGRKQYRTSYTADVSKSVGQSPRRCGAMVASVPPTLTSMLFGAIGLGMVIYASSQPTWSVSYDPIYVSLGLFQFCIETDCSSCEYAAHLCMVSHC